MTPSWRLDLAGRTACAYSMAILLVLFLWFLFAGMNAPQTGSIEEFRGQPLVAAVLADGLPRG